MSAVLLQLLNSTTEIFRNVEFFQAFKRDRIIKRLRILNILEISPF